MFATVAMGLFLGFPGLAKAQSTLFDRRAGIDPDRCQRKLPHAIAGEFDDASGNTHGFVLTKGDLRTVVVPSADFTSVNGINADGGDLRNLH